MSQIELRTFGVLCMTTRTPGDEQIDFHLPPRALEAVFAGKFVLEGLELRQSSGAVEFGGKWYLLDYLRTGLGGKSVVLRLKDDDGYILELYTDTPVFGTNATPESLRKDAAEMVQRKEIHRRQVEADRMLG